MPIRNNKVIQVCDSCFKACCWHGESMCDDARTAGTTLLTVRDLKRLKREHPDNWADEKLIKVYGEVPVYGP